MLDFKVDEKLCTRCQECVRDCPSRIIEMPATGLPILTPEAEQNCIRCQHCLAICPAGAISILGKKPGDSMALSSTAMPSPDSMEMLIKGRRTTRRYKPENVDEDTITRLLEAASYAPTGANRRGLKFNVINTREKMKVVRQKLMEALQEALDKGLIPPHVAYLHAAVPAFFKYRADLIFRGAPHLLIVSAGPGSICPNEDAVIALSTFEMLAASMGLGTTWCGMLKMALECAPSQKAMFDLEGAVYYYAMLFGIPKVKYARTAQRDDSAEISMLDPR